MTRTYNGVVRAICTGLSLLAAASCSVLGASLDPLAKGGAAGDGGTACVSARCSTCPPEQTACGAECFTTANDPNHCGDCAKACNPGEVCGDGHCSLTCPEGQTNCNGSCADTQTDSKNCGVCGTSCDPTSQECVEGKCVVACKSMLNQPVTDPWGWSWDGLERAAATFTVARTTCTDFRGRLPTVSELHRVSATQSATVGQTVHTNPLWSLAPASPGVHVRVRLSDAAITSADTDTTTTNYRCVCPPPAPKAFTGPNCYGAPNTNACATLAGENGRYNIDTKDRAPVPKTAAVWECSFQNARLAPPVQLVEAIQQNVGAGSGKTLHSADEIKNDQSLFVSWTDGKDFTFDFAKQPNSVSAGAPTDAAPFRCIGETSAPPALPLPPGQWTATGRRNIDEADQPAAGMVDAMVHCWETGGHLPTMTDLNELVLQGAPGGSGTFLWTGDQTGANLAVVARWTGVQVDHLYGGADMTWAFKNENKPYRCVYYAVDPTYGGPPAEACAGGCTVITSPGGANGAKSWFDSTDRAGLNVTAAIDSCRKLGGHLPSERDLTEAVRSGLPNGSDAWILTSDAMIGSGSYNLLVGNVKWKATMPTFDDAWSTRSSWSHTSEVEPYRCMWTNELR